MNQRYQLFNKPALQIFLSLFLICCVPLNFYWTVIDARAGEVTLSLISPFMTNIIYSGISLLDCINKHSIYLLYFLTALALTFSIILCCRKTDKDRSIWLFFLLLTTTLTFILAALSGLYLVSVLLSLALFASYYFYPLSKSRTGKGDSIISLLLILIAAVICRTWLLAEQSPGFGGHGSGHLQLSLDIFEEIRTTLNNPDASVWELLPKYWRIIVNEQHGPVAIVNAIGFYVFGAGFVEARITQAFLGFIVVYLGYVLGRSFSAPSLGLTVALLLAFSPWHLAISRYNTSEHVLAPIHVLLCLYFCFSAARLGLWRSYLGVGLAISCSWYLYATNQIVPLIGVLFFSYKILFEKNFFKRDWLKMLTAALIFMALSYPFLSSSYRQGKLLPVRSGYSFDSSSNYALVNKAEILISNVSKAMQELFVHTSDDWYFKPGGGLGLIEAAFFIPGLFLCLSFLFRGQYRDRTILILLLLLCGLLPGVLLRDVIFRRLMVSQLAVLIISAIALDDLYKRIKLTGRRYYFVAPVVVLFIAFYVITGIAVYFGKTKIPESDRSTHATVLAQFMNKNIGQSYIYFIVSNEEMRNEYSNIIRLAIYQSQHSKPYSKSFPGDLYQIISLSDFQSVYKCPKIINNKVTYLTPYYTLVPKENIKELKGQVKPLIEEKSPELYFDYYGNPKMMSWEIVNQLKSCNTP